jgi:hypothetical protein
MEDANDDVVFDALDCIRVVQDSHVVKKAPASVVVDTVVLADAK